MSLLAISLHFPYFSLARCTPSSPDASLEHRSLRSSCREPPRAGTLLLVPPTALPALRKFISPETPSVCRVQYQLRGSRQESTMHMEMKQDVTNLPLGQPQLAQTVLSRAQLKEFFMYFHILTGCFSEHRNAFCCLRSHLLHIYNF